MISSLKIYLTAEEQVLLDKIVFEPPQDEHFDKVILRQSCKEAASLAIGLLSRKAIPEIRLRYFTDPKLNIGKAKMSRKQVFEANGTKGKAIFEHAHFLPYLKYFVFGPDLPQEVIEQFCTAVADELFISGGDMDHLWKITSNATRQRRLNPLHASEEYFKLALECGLLEKYARSIRDTVRKINNRQ